MGVHSLPHHLQLQLDGPQFGDVHHHYLRLRGEEVGALASDHAHQHGAQPLHLRHLTRMEKEVKRERNTCS
ncbi:hypothetical protein SKAU_G00154220 [Synaphobranchus kaupii]|uniref:Uncharacterized protein n=1 Tax=Synaphobranchus kaupii TaxID=118154 RepID=A0A9Q1FH87_SYNKA|nr:hypothetical protein SKAU_G00154220 [Synaphobranchus kaupii]